MRPRPAPTSGGTPTDCNRFRAWVIRAPRVMKKANFAATASADEWQDTTDVNPSTSQLLCRALLCQQYTTRRLLVVLCYGDVLYNDKQLIALGCMSNCPSEWIHFMNNLGNDTAIRFTGPFFAMFLASCQQGFEHFRVYCWVSIFSAHSGVSAERLKDFVVW